MQITKVKVRKLYGLHDYDIMFNEEECLKIIHAPNGFGKTTIFKLIQALMTGDLETVRQIPFTQFEIQLDQLYQIQVSKKGEVMVYTLVLPEGSQILEVQPHGQGEEEGILKSLLKNLEEEVPVYFINASRLWFENDGYKEEGRLMPMVLKYANELSGWIQEALTAANAISQALDRSFPMRLLKGAYKSVLPLAEIQSELTALEEKRRLLADAGLFAGSMQEIPYEVEQLDESMQRVLTLYILDSKEKFKALEGLARKLHLFCSIINKRFTYKVMEISRKEGFVFQVPTHEKLKADQLSSGEQNALALIFMMLFKAPAHALILLDEPEISLHIAWQQSFLEDMEAIAKLAQIRLMIATHSPDIINGRWDLATGLEEDE